MLLLCAFFCISYSTTLFLLWPITMMVLGFFTDGVRPPDFFFWATSSCSYLNTLYLNLSKRYCSSHKRPPAISIFSRFILEENFSSFTSDDVVPVLRKIFPVANIILSIALSLNIMYTPFAPNNKTCV